MKLGQIAFRNINRNRKRSILSVTATAIATFSIVFMFAYLEGLEDDMRKTSFNYTTGEILIRHRNFDEKIFSMDLAVDRYREILEYLEGSYPAFNYSPRLEFPSSVIKGDRTIICFGLAVDYNREIEYLDLNSKLISGTFPKDSIEVLIGSGLAHELGLEVGDKFTPITTTRRGASSGITFRVSGIAKFGNGQFTNKTYIASLEKIPEILKMPGAVTKILIKGLEDDPEIVSDILSRNLYDEGFKDVEAIPWTKIGLAKTMIDMADISYTLMAVFFFILASSVIANTMLMVVFERRREIGTITAMGMSDLEVIRLFFLEALVLGTIGAASGVILGVLITLPLSIYGMDLSSFGQTLDLGTSWLIYPQINLKSTLLVFIYSVFVASFVSFFPSRSAVKVDPVIALRSH